MLSIKIFFLHKKLYKVHIVDEKNSMKHLNIFQCHVDELINDGKMICDLVQMSITLLFDSFVATYVASRKILSIYI